MYIFSDSMWPFSHVVSSIFNITCLTDRTTSGRPSSTSESEMRAKRQFLSFEFQVLDLSFMFWNEMQDISNTFKTLPKMKQWLYFSKVGGNGEKQRMLRVNGYGSLRKGACSLLYRPSSKLRRDENNILETSVGSATKGNLCFRTQS